MNQIVKFFLTYLHEHGVEIATAELLEVKKRIEARLEARKAAGESIRHDDEELAAFRKNVDEALK